MVENVYRSSSIYGPVQSWRYGRSLGIDPIGIPSTCSFNCVYCQLGEIERNTLERQIFIPTEQVIQDLEEADPWQPIDVVTLSGHGEPTLALNLEDILIATKQVLEQPIVVLTNSSLITDHNVRRALTFADRVSAKLDAISPIQMQSINRPSEGVNLAETLMGLKKFRQQYQGHLAIQTMVLSDWSENTEIDYLQQLQEIQPDEVQLNIPSRPRIIAQQQRFFGTLSLGMKPYGFRQLGCVNLETLKALSAKIHDATQIPVRHAPVF